MLQAFRLQNFRSFASPQTLDLAASSDRGHEATHCVRPDEAAMQRFLRAVVIFGPNGAGKSNLFAAVRSLRDLALKSYTAPNDHLLRLYTPFKFGTTDKAPTALGIDVVLFGIRYCYDLAYDERQIRWERLLVYKTGKAQRWFERRATAGGPIEWAPFSSHLHGPREMWRRATSPTSLFLSTAYQLNCTQLNPLIEWLSTGLTLHSHPSRGDLSLLPAMIARPGSKAMVISFLRALDVQISDIRVVDEKHAAPPATERPLFHPRHPGEASDVELLHTAKDGTAVWIAPGREAAGIRELLALLPKFIAAAHAGAQLIIDDFGKHLHPTLTSTLLSTALKISASSFQLIATAHEPALMSMELLRRDQIWLIEQDEDSSSKLIALVRRHARRSEALSRNYLRGKFGAVPGGREANS